MVFIVHIYNRDVRDVQRFWAVSSPSIDLRFFNVKEEKKKMKNILKKLLVYVLIGIWADASYTVLKWLNN